MAEPYPLNQRTIISASKSRNQPAAFKVAEPRRGYGYVQAVGSDTPVFWDIQFRFTRGEAVRFQMWFKQIINMGIDEFTMPIRTEFGLIEHTCRFLPESLLNTQDDGQAWTYTAQIMARAQVIPDGFYDAEELILELEDWLAWAEVLDLSIATIAEA